MNIVVRRLIAKELHVFRWFIAGAALTGIASVLVATLGETAFKFGALTWLTTIIAAGVMLAIYGIWIERKEHSLSFVLSLPLSSAQYIQAKMLGQFAGFLIVWSVSSVAALLLVFWNDSVPDGLAPYLVLLCVFMLTNFSVVICGALHVRSEAMSATLIVVTNMGVSIFMFTVGPLPGIQQHIWSAQPAWNATFWTLLGCELAVLLITFILPFFFVARRRDFL
jgi:hypothetical protein